ncbi:hypothetical protein T4D_14390 [Trichinella pseudospiralis]|uniref:Uncharacterized protein n=1 Tax=Trichinella pseudospiralis TaxID=6337 RepID=A0A0V1FU62_TRIPS|nr:hypothetical protein T4D_14390 [Trichinella pseudospiralis]
MEFNLAWLAQSVEHGTLNPRVVGSSPTSGVLLLSDLYYLYLIFISQLTVSSVQDNYTIKTNIIYEKSKATLISKLFKKAKSKAQI